MGYQFPDIALIHAHSTLCVLGAFLCVPCVKKFKHEEHKGRH